MLIDSQLKFCEDMAITVTAATATYSTNFIDLANPPQQVRDIAPGEPVRIYFKFPTALAGAGGTLTIDLVTDANLTGGGGTVVATRVITVASGITEGWLDVPYNTPFTWLRYLGLTFTTHASNALTGSPTVSAWMGYAA